MSPFEEFDGQTPTWCPGCGNWAIGAVVKRALANLGLSPSSVFVSFGIGCSGNMNDFLNAYAVHALHGRAIPVAIGFKLANHKMPVVAIVGDGDCYGEGGNHFLHALRGNHDITVIVHDNSVYGLTTGQSAPTSPKGFRSKSTPDGLIETPLNPLALAISQGGTFVSQAYASRVPQITELIQKAITHKGFSLVNVLQPCVTFNRTNTYDYYDSKVYDLPSSYIPHDQVSALKHAMNMTIKEEFPLGIVYESKRPAFHECLPQLGKQTLLERGQFEGIHEILEHFI